MSKPTHEDFEVIAAKFSSRPDGDRRMVLSIKRNLPPSVVVKEFYAQHVTKASPSAGFAYHGGAVWKNGNEAGTAYPEFVFDALGGLPIYSRDSDGSAVHPGPVSKNAVSWIELMWKDEDGDPHPQSVKVLRVTV